MNIIKIATGNYRDEDEESISEIIERIQREDMEKEEEKKRLSQKKSRDLANLMSYRAIEDDSEPSDGAEVSEDDSFYDKIYAAVCLIPRGRVATYGQVAALAGNGGAARAVGNALHKNPMPGVIPCHRVVNAQGRLAPHFAFGGADEQYVDLVRYQWRNQ